MSPVDLWQLAGSIVPEVESPWPERIGLGFPFTVAGAASMLAGVATAGTSQTRRERWMNLGSLGGFFIGALLYLVALLVQVVSAL